MLPAALTSTPTLSLQDVAEQLSITVNATAARPLSRQSSVSWVVTYRPTLCPQAGLQSERRR